MNEPANPRLLRALRRQPNDRTPIWIMRQAGRYLPEYKRLRNRAGSFLNLCCTPELACEAALQPLRRYELDAAILFSDILTIPDAMGLGLEFTDKGPSFARPIRSSRDVANLGVPDPDQDLRYVMDALALLHGEVGQKLPVIGFAGSPWTLATYMVDGKSGGDFTRIRSLLAEDPELLEQLLAVLVEAVALYLRAQIAAGAAVVMLFDSWGAVLEGEQYVHFSMRPIQQVLEALGSTVPCIVYARGGGDQLQDVCATGCEAIGLDETVRLRDAREIVGARCALQGNLDTLALRLPEAEMRAAARAVLADYDGQAGHIFNLGHGITPEIHPHQVTHLIDEVHRFGSGTQA